MAIKDDFFQAQEVLTTFINSEGSFEAIEAASKIMSNTLKLGGKIISCGNGGSMADAIHFAEELTGRFREDRPSLAAVAISDAAHITCVANDYGFEFVFSLYPEGVGNKGDVLLGISTSGNSKNVIRAAEVAKKKGMKIVMLTGKDGGLLKDHCDVEIRAPQSKFADRAQEIHIKVIHSLIQYIEYHF